MKFSGTFEGGMLESKEQLQNLKYIFLTSKDWINLPTKNWPLQKKVAS